jgi:hypothetical protein
MTLVDVRFGLVELLTSNASINAIVGGTPTRIFPVKMKQGETRDSIVYNRISEFETYKMDGPSGLVSARYQLDAWSRSTDDATVLANLVKELFGGFHGQIVFDPPSPTNFVNVQLIEVIDGRDDYDNETLMYRVGKDYFVWYEERNG